MKRITKLITTALLGMAFMATSVIALAGEVSIGAAGAAIDESLTLEEMLTYAIQDEYMAQGEYKAIIEEYGVQKPFSNIVKAEGRHIAMLLPLFDKYDVAVPKDDSADRVVLPGSLPESYKAGVDAEVLNIEMYERFLKENLPEDVKTVFERLLSASEKHLSAFTRAASSSGLENGKTSGNLRRPQRLNGNKFGRGSVKNPSIGK